MLSSEKIAADEFGPEYVVNVYDPRTGMEGVLVIDNTARGPGKGGIRLVPDVSVQEVYRLARAMTWKNALAEIPFGGAKAGIRADPRKIDKAAYMKAFGEKLRPLIPGKYIAGPDMNTAEAEMKVFAEAVGTLKASTGKPASIGGLPHELGSTGFGVAHSTLVALDFYNWEPKKTKGAIEGFGNVGVFTARFLSEKGVKIVAVSDSKGTVYNEMGLDVKALESVKQKTGSVVNYKPGKVLKGEELFSLPVDVLIPGARPDVINDSNKNAVKAKLIVQAANIPIPERVELELEKKGIKMIPDFVANAGGVISSYVETINGTPEQMFKIVEEKIRKNTALVLKHAKESKITAREAALEIAKERVRKAMDSRKEGPAKK
ncbi:MAG TPA: Glu/Leu/Phe/Val dehydrogenase [Candidatus Norongarragalinales archaeon]|nr:Glu/Leu/Phe/Val dehydrogenase [Candidatus Norongarragalinales archaeon]